MSNLRSICEENTFQEIHQTHANSLRNFIFYKVGNLDAANDLVQEAFVTLWENCKKVSWEKAKSYLFTVANRKFLDQIKHNKVVMAFEIRKDHPESQLQDNPEYLYRQQEFKTKLEEVISALPEKQRVVFLLSRIDKMSNLEIAHNLDISIKTVEKHITSSLKTLRSELDEINHLKF